MSMSPTPAASVAMLYPTVDADALLSHPRRSLIFDRLLPSSGLESQDFEVLYRALILNFAQWAQVLPVRVGAKLCSLLDYGLERGVMALQNYQEESKQEFDPLLGYLYFTAALLKDIGKLVTQQEIMLSNSEGQFLGRWNPARGSLNQQGDYYKLRYFGDQWVGMQTPLTLQLAPQVLPSLGYAWLMSERIVTQQWLDALSGEGESGRKLTKWLELVDHKLEELTFQMPGASVQPIQPSETQLGEEFLVWLNEGLQANHILINHPSAAVYVLANRALFLECPRIFRFFCEALGAEMEWLEVCNQFIALGLTTTPIGSLQFEQYRFRSNTLGGAGVGLLDTLAANRAVAAQKANMASEALKSAGYAAAGAKVREGLVVPSRYAPLIFGKNPPPISQVNLSPVSGDSAPALRESVQHLSDLRTLSSGRSFNRSA